jgi:hypothetical protein
MSIFPLGVGAKASKDLHASANKKGKKAKRGGKSIASSRREWMGEKNSSNDVIKCQALPNTLLVQSPESSSLRALNLRLF